MGTKSSWVGGAIPGIIAALLWAPSTRAAEPAAAAPTVERPPQIVVLAFDGSKSTAMWQETRDFAATMTRAGKPLKFTYFINAAYYIADAYKRTYIAPAAGAGVSAIGFGGAVGDVLARFEQTNFAFLDGHEIANHATGHFDGTQWSEAQWRSELAQFFSLLANLFQVNQVAPPASFPGGWALRREDFVGFRAPQLGRNPAMYVALAGERALYDTSKTARPTVWPRREDGLWQFPLGEIEIAGTTRRTLSMDYNFYYVQSQAREDLAHASAYEEQMLQSYFRYFDGNYNGTRAPLNIGHHFSKWNGGAYWRAMQRFAEAACGLPEVQCVDYRALLRFMNSRAPGDIAAYERGQFARGREIRLADPRYGARAAPRFRFDFGERQDIFVGDPPEAHEP